MLFNSWPFAGFLATTFLLYYLPALRGFQTWLLIAASFVFYSWTAPLLLLLLCWSIGINAVTSHLVSVSAGAVRLRWAATGVLANLFVLAVFKYGGLLTSLAVELLNLPRTASVSTLLSIPLPVGISFYTFEGISLLVDVFRSERDGARGEPTLVKPRFSGHLANTSLFIAFFPHLSAGPILKARQFFPQVGPKRFRDIRWESAFRALVTGYFLKGVVADNLNAHTLSLSYPYYKSLSLETGLVLLYGYSIQIFADFAGYSLIAIGLATLFGYQLPANFNFPYISRSLAEFWRRWHISLSTWLRDYLYLPLGGNRISSIRTYFNLAVVMVLGGLWHGAAWSYAAWGAYHGLGLAIERFFTRERERTSGAVVGAITDVVRMLAVFLFVTFGWLLFKLPNFDQVQEFLAVLIQNRALPLSTLIAGPVLVFSLPVVLYHLLHLQPVRAWRRETAAQHPAQHRLTMSFAYALMLFMIVFNSGSGSAFIYFQF